MSLHLVSGEPRLGARAGADLSCYLGGSRVSGAKPAAQDGTQMALNQKQYRVEFRNVHANRA
jgi:hypothetical protein